MNYISYSICHLPKTGWNCVGWEAGGSRTDIIIIKYIRPVARAGDTGGVANPGKRSPPPPRMFWQNVLHPPKIECPRPPPPPLPPLASPLGWHSQRQGGSPRGVLSDMWWLFQQARNTVCMEAFNYSIIIFYNKIIYTTIFWYITSEIPFLANVTLHAWHVSSYYIIC